MAPPEASPARWLASALGAAALAVAVWWVVQVRSAAPPPPRVTFPWAAPASR